MGLAVALAVGVAVAIFTCRVPPVVTCEMVPATLSVNVELAKSRAQAPGANA